MLKETIAKIRTALQEVDGVPSEVLSQLAGAEREAIDVLESLKAANAESKSRKLKIKELEESGSDVESLKAELEKYKADNEKLSGEIDQARKVVLERYQAEAKKFYDQLAIGEKDPNFPKIKAIQDQLLVKDGKKLKELENYTQDELKELTKQAKLLEKTGFFTESKQTNEAETFIRSQKATGGGKFISSGFRVSQKFIKE